MNLKSLPEFYFLQFAPMLLVLNFIFNYASTDSETFFAALFCCVYSQTLSGIRLIQLKLIQRKDFFKVFIPWWTAKYFYELNFGIK